MGDTFEGVGQNTSMVHDLSPFAIHFWGNVGIRWYGLAYMVGFIGGYFLIRWLVQRQKSGLNPDMVADFVTYVAIGTLIGGRLGYCVFYSPDLFIKFKPDFPFWGVFAVNEGGMASHGGMIGIVIACILFGRRHGINYLYLFDLVTMASPIGVFFGRIANFINGELVGRPAPPDLAWAVRFPSDIYLWPKDEPQRLSGMSAVVEKLGVAQTQWVEWLDQFKTHDTARNKIYETLERIVTEIQSKNEAVRDALGPLLTPRHPSQLYGALGEGILVFVVLFFLWRRPRKAGFIGCAFLITYGIIRISDEMFRMPDAHIGYQWLGLTRGQWLSTGMVAIGIVLMVIWNKSVSQVIPGWGRIQSIKLNRK